MYINCELYHNEADKSRLYTIDNYKLQMYIIDRCDDEFIAVHPDL